jgi:hypothetical protein
MEMEMALLARMWLYILGAYGTRWSLWMNVQKFSGAFCDALIAEVT